MIEAEIIATKAKRRRHRRVMAATFGVLLIAYVGTYACFYLRSREESKIYFTTLHYVSVETTYLGANPLPPGERPLQHEILATFYLPVNAIHVNVFGGLNASWDPMWHFR